MGMVPKSTKSETKIWKNISFFKIIGIITTIMISLGFSQILFTGAMRVFFIIFCTVTFIICTMRSPTDPNKSFIRGLGDFLKFKFRAKDIYGCGTEEYDDYERKCNEHKNKKAIPFKRLG